MKSLLITVGIVLLVALVMALHFLFAFAVFKLVFWAGSPKYVAVICAVGTFIITTSLAKPKK